MPIRRLLEISTLLPQASCSEGADDLVKPAKGAFTARAAGDPRASTCQVSEASLPSEGHGFIRAISDSGEARTLLPQAAPRETGNEKRETARSAALCTCVLPNGRTCQSPAMKKSTQGLCYQHSTRETGNEKRETARSAAAAELLLTQKRRAARALNDRRAYALRPLIAMPILDTPEAIAFAAERFEYALAVGALDPRARRVHASLLRIATMNLKGMERDRRLYEQEAQQIPVLTVCRSGSSALTHEVTSHEMPMHSVPQGRPIIARHEMPGKGIEVNLSPVGTADTLLPQAASVVPPGLSTNGASTPALRAGLLSSVPAGQKGDGR